jgi:hypothetical protein|tara:strand:- start:524 stop:697 length:174 start_codon:yes stop_codon:yes gene_type:complete
MEKTERRKYDKEQKKKAQLEEDLLPEVMLKEEMEMTKRKVGINNVKEPIIERIRGYV